MELVAVNQKRNWVKWLKEQNKPKQITEQDVILDAAQRAGIALGKKYGWDSVAVRMTDTTVHMEYIWDKRLYYALIPVDMIKKTNSIKPYMEDEVLRLHLEILELERCE